MEHATVRVYTDAGSRNNPGPAAIAYSVYDSSGKLLEAKGKFVGKQTNNVAEYMAIIAGLNAASKFSDGEVLFFSDSKLAMSQLGGKFKVRKKHLAKLVEDVREKEKKFEKVTYKHVGRGDQKISRMDKLVNQVLDEERK